VSLIEAATRPEGASERDRWVRASHANMSPGPSGPHRRAEGRRRVRRAPGQPAPLDDRKEILHNAGSEHVSGPGGPSPGPSDRTIRQDHQADCDVVELLRRDSAEE
jgi:hypothetical protein